MLIPGMNNRMTHEFEEYRPYTSLEQFRREIGKYVDEDEVARLEQYVFVPLNLNPPPGISSRPCPAPATAWCANSSSTSPNSDMDHSDGRSASTSMRTRSGASSGT